jgi:hypothetical protein
VRAVADPDDLLGDRVLDLQAGVDLEERERVAGGSTSSPARRRASTASSTTNSTVPALT